MIKNLGPVYPITHAFPGHPERHALLAKAYLEAGIRLFQVREKDLPDRQRLADLIKIQELCSPVGADLIVNDRVDLARLSGAGGVHIGQEDLPIEAARSILPRPAIIGISTHTDQEFLQAQEMDVDYVAMDPIFESSTKPGYRQPLGIEMVRRLAKTKRKPLVVVGGINIERARSLWDAGVDSVAVVSDINDAESVQRRIEQYLTAFQEHT